MADALETAASIGLSLAPRGANEPSLELSGHQPESFDTMVESWFSITYMLNNLNRGLGFPDGYPFILSDAVVKKSASSTRSSEKGLLPSDRRNPFLRTRAAAKPFASGNAPAAPRR